jgi:6-linalyl-2-O,3-dimethylflaviolin/7-geranyloxy-5-hydroxy-2-methoxy-3-methylnaphthalene-1,4-dione synthase
VHDDSDLESIYSAIEESARLLEVTCARDMVRPILTAYADVLAQSAISFRVATGARHAGDLDCRLTMIPTDVDPYARALSKGLTDHTDHPVSALLSDIAGQCRIDCYGIDFGVVGGFKKTWQFFQPHDLQKVSTLGSIPTMPQSLMENADFFARYGLDDKASLTGIDYQSRTVNVYFGELPAECREPGTISAMLREIELPAPSEQLLKVGQHAFNIYVTLSWDSLKVERICFSAMTPEPAELSARLEPRIEYFARNHPYTHADFGRRFLYAVASATDGEYYKLASFYKWPPAVLELMR